MHHWWTRWFVDLCIADELEWTVPSSQHLVCSGVQALPTVCEKEVQTGPQQLTHSTLEEHLVKLRELLISATSAIPTKAYDAIWSEGRVLKKLAESRSRQASGINMETVEFYLHSALKFLEAAHTQEKRRDRHTRR